MSAYSRWYERNGQKLSKARRLRYHNDAQYRQDALDRAKKQRAEKKKPSDGKTITFGKAAELLDISTVTLRSWKSKDYYPEPTRHGRHIAFSSEQVAALSKLKEVFVLYGWNMKSEAAKKALDDEISLIYANWN